MSTLTPRDHISLITREAMGAALSVIDAAYLAKGQGAGPLGDELAEALERTLEDALLAHEADPEAPRVPAFTNITERPEEIVFHDGEGTAWLYERDAFRGESTCWRIMSKPYPTVQTFRQFHGYHWLTTTHRTPRELHDEYLSRQSS